MENPKYTQAQIDAGKEAEELLSACMSNTSEKIFDCERWNKGMEKIRTRYQLNVWESNPPVKRIPIFGQIGLEEWKFLECIDFRLIAFKDRADFSFAIFEKVASFVFTSFEDEACFASTSFKDEVRFSSTSFESWTDFSKAIFKKEASFSSATFQQWASFYEVVFGKWTSFESVIFNDGATFNSANFKSGVTFKSANFKKETYWDFPVLKGIADFSSTTFEEDADFQNVTFCGDANFQQTTFKQNALFCEPYTYKNACEFHRATFLKHAHFHTVPDFSLDCIKAPYEKLSKEKDLLTIMQSHLHLYNFMVRKEDEARDFDRAEEWYMKEVEMRKKILREKIKRTHGSSFSGWSYRVELVLYWLYDCFSENGCSVGRSFGMGLGLLGVFWLCIACYAYTCLSSPLLDIGGHLVRLIIVDKDAFLALKNEYGISGGWITLMQLILIGQSVLLLFAVRRKFRRSGI